MAGFPAIMIHPCAIDNRRKSPQSHQIAWPSRTGALVRQQRLYPFVAQPAVLSGEVGIGGRRAIERRALGEGLLGSLQMGLSSLAAPLEYLDQG